MKDEHISFWVELSGKVGPPIFAASLVACLLSGGFEWLHGALIFVGFFLTVLNHWKVFHND